MKNRIGETSYKKTALGIVPRSKLILLEIEGTKKAWDFILKKNANGEIILSLAFIKELHKIGFGWIFPEFGGQFRKIDVTVSRHNPPKFYLISQLMVDFIEDTEVRSKNIPKLENEKFLFELVSFLAWFHHKFLWIHPFQDYNGRIARLLINVILFNFNLPPIELKVETQQGRNRYVKSLDQADKGNFVELEKIIREAIEESVNEINYKE